MKLIEKFLVFYVVYLNGYDFVTCSSTMVRFVNNLPILMIKCFFKSIYCFTKSFNLTIIIEPFFLS
jgi:hypothetical protein